MAFRAKGAHLALQLETQDSRGETADQKTCSALKLMQGRGELQRGLRVEFWGKAEF